MTSLSFCDRSGWCVAAAAALLSACSPDGAGSEQTLPNYPTFAAAPATHSVLDVGHAEQPILATDASVYAEADGYHLFFTTLFCRAALDEAPSWLAASRKTCADVPLGTTAYAYSSDRGHSWRLRQSPVLLPRAHAWDSGDLESPFVARVGDDLMLLYAGFGAIEARFGIGGAKLHVGAERVSDVLLDDARSFVQLEQPLIPADFEHAGAINNAQEPSIVVYDDRIDLYYVAIGLQHPELGFVEGQLPTGIGLRRRSFDRQLSPLANTDEQLLAGINIAEVREIDGVLHLHYTSDEGNDYHRGERILWRQSSDAGGTWSEPVEALGFDHGEFDNWGVMAPSLVVEPNGAVLFFTAWQATDGPCSQSARAGMPDSDDPAQSQHCLFASVGRAESVRP